MTYYTELTLDEAMADPMIQLVMRADHVDPAKLRRAWTPLIDQLRTAKSDDDAADEQDTPAVWRDLVHDCIRSTWSTKGAYKTKAGLR